MWDLSCIDWQDRILAGDSLIPDNLPLNEADADLALQIFDQLCLPDVPGLPKMRDAAGQWFRDLVRVAFGSWHPHVSTRFIRDIFAMLPKGQSKTTYSAGFMLVGLLMNLRPRAEALFVAPTQAISDNAYEKAVGMIDASPDLKRRFRPRDHIKTIEDLNNHTELKVKTFDVNILTGSILIMVLLDELHLLGRNAHTAKVLRQIRGGLEKTPEGLLVITTTQSDEQPAGAFKDELKMARAVRDGAFRGKRHRPLLPILYEFPPAIASERTEWERPETWPLVMPNLGRSVHLQSLIDDWESERAKGEHATRIWASQHLNIEIGVGLGSDAWIGAEYWADATDPAISMEWLIANCDAITAGIDGGGLDDLFGLCLIGRHRITRDWHAWFRAWCWTDVLERRKEIAARLQDFAAAGDLTICRSDDPQIVKRREIMDRIRALHAEDRAAEAEKLRAELPAVVPQDVREIADIIERVRDAGRLPEKYGIGVDPVGVAAMLDELDARGIEGEQLSAVQQGYRLNGAVLGMERKLKDGTFWHAGQDMMDWVVGNAKVEQRGNAVLVTKQISGKAKIDPLVAGYNAFQLMSRNPEAKGLSVYRERGALVA